MKEIVLFAILDRYAEWEAANLAAGLNQLAGDRFKAKTVSLGLTPIRSIGGFRTLPDYDLQAVPAGYRALILIGGESWRTEEALKLRPLVEDCLRQNRLLGGICDGAAFLGAMGCLNSVHHTVNDLTDLKRWAGDAYEGEALFVPRQAVRDGHIVTANGTAALEFAREVLLGLQAAPKARVLEWYQFYKQGFYKEA